MTDAIIDFLLKLVFVCGAVATLGLAGIGLGVALGFGLTALYGMWMS